ncbi:uncharacterized protein VTP21DRAFT_9347 [Calcarisporiella thermophila]|uniref:uncharacterized protein n=1 Tax=Calcarisporiella thermophila TaxID=911321 RepID=UPI0037432A36
MRWYPFAFEIGLENTLFCPTAITPRISVRHYVQIRLIGENLVFDVPVTVCAPEMQRRDSGFGLSGIDDSLKENTPELESALAESQGQRNHFHPISQLPLITREIPPLTLPPSYFSHTSSAPTAINLPKSQSLSAIAAINASRWSESEGSISSSGERVSSIGPLESVIARFFGFK